jgi:hypothetical protein
MARRPLRAVAHRSRRARPAAGLALVLLVAGCAFEDDGTWADQLAPSGPCYEANLLDGVDEVDTAELHAVFACLDGGGGLTAFRPLDAAWDTPTREDVAGLVFARWVNGLDAGGVSLAGLVRGVSDALGDPAALDDTLDLALELAYATPAPRLAELDVSDAAVAEAGLLAPGLDVLGAAAGTLLDAPEASGPVEDLLRSRALPQLLWAAAATSRSEPGPLLDLATHWPDDLADVVRRTRDASNDRWSEASGDSARDLARWLLVRQSADGRYVWDHVATPMLPILEDPVAASLVGEALASRLGPDEAARLPAQLAWLLSVDARGGALEPSDTTAVAALVRLLRNGNTDIDCTVDLGLGDVHVALGNLSVALLTQLAALDGDTATGGVTLLGDVLGAPLTDDALLVIADTGVCPVVDRQLVDDLHALDRLGDPRADVVLSVLLGLLRALEGHVPDLVDTVSAVWDAGLVPPLEELLADVAGSPFAARLAATLPALLDPASGWDPALFPAGVMPPGFADAWEWARDGLAPEGPLTRLQPLTATLVGAQGTWDVVGRLGALAGQPDAAVRGILPRLGTTLDADPTLTWAADAADVLADDATLQPALVLLEADGLRDAAIATRTGDPGPFATLTTWALDGTLDRALTTLDALLHLLSPEPA